MDEKIYRDNAPEQETSVPDLIDLLRSIRAYYKTTMSWDELFEDDVLAAIGKDTGSCKVSEVTENGQENIMGDS